MSTEDLLKNVEDYFDEIQTRNEVPYDIFGILHKEKEGCELRAEFVGFRDGYDPATRTSTAYPLQKSICETHKVSSHPFYKSD